MPCRLIAKGESMALVPCVRCRQPFYASCHDSSCLGALCPSCEYGEPTSDNRRPAHMEDRGGIAWTDGTMPGLFEQVRR